MEIVSIHHFSFTVLDLDRTIDFYTRLLGFELRSRTLSEHEGLGTALFGSRWGVDQKDAAIEVARMELYGIRVEFIQYLNPPSKPYSLDPSIAGSAHVALRVRDIEAERKRLETAGVQFHSTMNLFGETGKTPRKWCYFRDPDGIIIELVEELPIDVQLERMASRIKETRLERGLTLHQVARMSSISAAHLSQIERGRSVPSVGVLLDISFSLGLPGDYFLRPDGGLEVQPTAQVSEAARHVKASIDEGRRAVTWSTIDNMSRTEGGLERQHLARGDGSLELVRIRCEVGASSDTFVDTEDGQEYGVVLEGTLLLELGYSSHVLEPGSSIVYDRRVPHRFTNIGHVPVVGIWAVLSSPRCLPSVSADAS